MLPLMERPALFVDRLILLLGRGIAHKQINTLADALKLRLLDDGFGRLKVLVVGDLMLDRYILGDVDRISPEAPVPVLA